MLLSKMIKSTNDDSSESDGEYFVSSSQINLNSSFFANKDKKPSKTLNESNESNDDEEFDDNANDNNSLEFFSQVLKNLESTQTISKKNESDNEEKQGNMNNKRAVAWKETKHIKVEKLENTSHISQRVNELLFEGEQKTFSSSDEEENESNKCSLDDAANSAEYTTPQEGVNITLPGTYQMLKKKKNTQNIQTIIENKINQRLRANQILIHKVGILCWLAHGFYLNNLINEAELMSKSLFLMSAENYPKSRADLNYLQKFIKWFKKQFNIKTSEKEESITKELLLRRIKDKEVFSYKELILLCIVILRAVGLNCRLIISLCPPPLKLQKSQLFKINSKVEADKDKGGESLNSSRMNRSNERNKKSEKHAVATSKNGSNIKTIVENSKNAREIARLESRRKASLILQEKLSKNKNTQSKSSKNNPKDADSKSHISKETIEQKKQAESTNTKETISKTISRQLRSRNQKANSGSNASTSQIQKGEKVTLSYQSLRDSQKYKTKEASVEFMDSDDSEEEEEEEEEEDEKEETLTKRKSRTTRTNTSKLAKGKNNNRKLLSSNEDVNECNKSKECEDLWIETYLESEESWICISITDEKIHCVDEIYKKASSPVLYVIAWNADGTIKDVTRRYCPFWLTVTRKQRVDEDWFKESLNKWKEKKTAISKAEDEFLAQRELEQPLPKTVGACKGHPLYVLRRHLLKYEALYPPDCVPLGYLPNGEAIYSRHCVYVLCSRETWIKKARVVKPAQEAYKVVKAIPKFDKLSGTKIVDRTLELFGEWQTTEYVPPVAKDGIVPRNEYGNVDLFQQKMLPKGTVYIDLPGLNRIARKLNIDCAPAVVGFKFGSMGAVPALEGYVVCSEYEDTLREAWEADQAESIKRAREKRHKRVYGNWKRLIDGLRIRERLARKYEFEMQKSATLNKRPKQKVGDEKRRKIL